MQTPHEAKIVILGLSAEPERYAFKAAEKLLANGYRELQGVHLSGQEVLGVPVQKDLAEISSPVHTITVYVRPGISSSMQEAILKLRPRRIIFNPGTENKELHNLAEKSGIQVVEACTLVLLATREF